MKTSLLIHSRELRHRLAPAGSRTLKTLPSLVESTFHIPEPIGHGIPPRTEDMNVAIISPLAFDRTGNRPGYGAGYYDRFPAAHPGMKTIGVAFACQEMPDLPGEVTDVRIDMIAIESWVIHVPSRLKTMHTK